MGREWFRRGVAALVSAALFVTTPGLGAYQALAQEVARVSQGAAVSGLGFAGAAGAVAPAAALAPVPAPSALQIVPVLALPVVQGRAPAAAQGTAAPAVASWAGWAASALDRTASAAGLRDGVAGKPAAAAVAKPAAAVSGRFSAAVAAKVADAKRPTFGLFRMLGASAQGKAVGTEAGAPRTGAAAPTRGAVATGAAEKTLAPSAETLASPTASKSWADRIFSFAKDAAPAALEPSEAPRDRPGELRPAGLAPASAEPAAQAKPVEQAPIAPAPAAPAARRSGWRTAARALAAFAVLGITAFGFIQLGHVSAFQHPLLKSLGLAGKWIGNVLAIAYPIPQIFKTFREGNAKSVPVSGAVAGSAAPLAQGAISAPIKAQPLWGLQNLFGAATTIAPLVFGRFLKGPVSWKQAALRTAVTCAAAAALSFGLYAAATAVVPGLAAAWLGVAGKNALLLGIQAAAFLGFLYIFGPTLIDLWEGRTPRAFTPGFSLSFAAASAGFVAWMLQAGLAAPAGSADRVWSLIYAAQNVVLFAVSSIAYLYSRRGQDIPTRAASRVRPPAVPGAVYGVKPGVDLPYEPTQAPAAAQVGPAAAQVAQEAQPAPAQAPEPGGAAPSPAPEIPAAKPVPLDYKAVWESFLGFRAVRGLRHSAGLKRLPIDADTPRILEQISKQFNITMPQLRDLAARFNLPLNAPRERWLRVYDRLQRANAAEFGNLDGRKYQGFRKLANVRYPEGWRGLLMRASEVHKHLAGFFVRVWYHLFDSFVFGYFRRAIAYRLFHANEDFLSIPKPKTPKGEPETSDPSKWLEAALSAESFHIPGPQDKLLANRWLRAIQLSVVECFVMPLGRFVIRRVTLAVMSAVALGVLAAFAPMLPLSLSLTAVPFLGHGILAAANGLPGVVAAVPFVGSAFAPVVGHAVDALVGDLVLGPMLNTLILTTMLTYPAAVRRRLMDSRGGGVKPPPFFSKEFLSAAALTAVSWDFWRENGKSYFGMMTVGAEIEGVMQYAGAVDSFIDQAWSPMTGGHFKLFHTIGAAVERPANHPDPNERSPIPWGGAITWGGSLLYKLQDLTGFNISDFTFGVVSKAIAVVHSTDMTRALANLPAHGGTAQALVHTVEQRAGAASHDWQTELREARERLAHLEASLTGKTDRLRELQQQSKPVTPSEQAEYDRLLKALDGKRLEEYAQSKLGEIHDLKDPKAEADARLLQLKKLQEAYEAVIHPDPTAPGYLEALQAKAAMLRGLQQKLDRVKQGSSQADASPLGTAAQADPQTVQELEAIVKDIEDLRVQSQGEMAGEQAQAKLLSAVNRLRNAALRERRDGKAMMEFYKNNAKLAAVMDIALGMNEAKAAIEQLDIGLGLVDGKLRKIDAARSRATRDQANADQNRRNMDRWRQEVRNDINDDGTRKEDMVRFANQSGMAVARIGAFRNDVAGLLARLDAEDAGQSGGAPAEYRRRIALLPQLVDWKTNGKPGDPDYRNLKDTRQTLQEVQDYAAKIEKGLRDIEPAPVNVLPALIILVPGVPDYSVVNPDLATAQRLLSERKAYWQEKLRDYTSKRDDVAHRLDSGYGGTELDDFGDSNPVSLPRWLSQSRQRLSDAQRDVQTLTSQIDQLAARIAANAPGASLPPLSGLSLSQLEDAIETYADKLSAVKIPSDGSDAAFQASMDLLSLGKLLPYAGRATLLWAKSDACVSGILKAMNEQLPAIKTGLDQIVATMVAIVDDVDMDLAMVGRMQQGWAPAESDGLALKDRKRELLRGAQATVQAAGRFVEGSLIPLIQDSIDSVKPGGDKYNKLFDAQSTLYNGVKKALEETLPWALASKGAAKGDVAGGLAGNQEKRQQYKKFIDGYDEGGVHHKGIREYQLEVQQRKDPDFAGTEERQGETQPFSLPRKISQYSTERAQRAQQFNQQAAEVNQILAQIDQLTANRFALASRFSLPATLDGNSAASVAQVQALVDNRLLPNLGDLLTQIGDEYKNKGGDISLGGTSGIPTGPQPSPTLPQEKQVALLALQAARRLVPTSLDSPQSAPAAYAVARILYSDAVVGASKDALENQIPVAEPFLAQGAQTLQRAIASLDQDDAYVRSNGASETAQQVVDRSVATYTDLNAFTKRGAEFFGLKGQWDQQSMGTLDRVQTYYDSTSDIYRNGQTASDSEAAAMREIRDVLQKTRDDLVTQYNKLKGWMDQLNRPEESALKRVAEDLRKIQEQTKQVLERNFEYHQVEDDHKRSLDALNWTLRRLDKAQQALDAKLARLADPGALPPALLARLDKLRAGGGAWLMDDKGRNAQTLVVPKANFSYFIDQLFAAFKPASSGQDLSGLRSEILANPQSLAQLIPDSKVIDFGDNADGFYLVYQTQFSVPNGLETSSLVTLGNVAKLGGNNVSVTGYTFASPANEVNAPWGDKGVVLQLESIQGKNWVNYFEVDLHRFVQDIPVDTSAGDNAKQSRLRVFNDHAELLFGGKLYVALTGFGDFALSDTKEKPYYFGGSGKVSWRFNEIVSLNAEEQRVYAKDPRWFQEQFNLDFSHWDPDLNRNLIIRADGENKSYRRDQAGPTIDVGKLIHSDDAFTVDFFVARQEGTDDYDQTSGGISILKGLTIKDAEGKPWAVISNRASGEMGQVYNTVADRVSVSLPNQGLVFGAEGRLVGDAKTYFIEATKKTGDHSSLSLSYGSRYVGAPDRLTLSLNSAFTLGELWRAVSQNAAEDLSGGEVLKGFDARMNEFYESRADDRMVQEMKAALVRDVGMKLLTQDVGTLSREIQELRRKGAFLDNTRVRGMVGFVTNPIGDALGDRLVGGGFQAGTYTEATLSRPPKALIESKIPELVETALRLQERAIERMQAVQGAIADVAQAQWQLKLARYAALNGQSPSVKAEGEAKVQEAVLALDQALIRFNLMTGRAPGDRFPFGDLSARDLEQLAAELEKLVASPDRVTRILHSLDQAEVEKAIGPEPLDLMQWVPWVDQVAISFGIQLQDALANQALVLGGRIRLPIYDPSSKERDNSYVLESQATAERIAERYEAYALKAEKEWQASRAAAEDAKVAGPRVAEAARDLRDAIRGYRNGLATEGRLRAAFERWDAYQREALRGRTAAALADAWSTMDISFAKLKPETNETVSLTSFSQAFELASKNSRSLAEVGFREKAAAAMTQANSHRIEKANLDLSIGAGLTADGIGWIPSIGITGIGITPILTFELKPEELRDLQAEKGAAEGEMYKALKAQLEMNLAVQFYENAATAKTTQAAYWTLRNEVLPKLQRRLAEAQASAPPGSDAVQRAQRALDDAALRRDQVWLAHRNAVATLNYLLGRPPEAPLSVDIFPERALAELKGILEAKDPVGTGRRILEARVQVAKAVETMADKDLKLEQLRLEPVSLVVRSLGRLLNTLSAEGIGNPDLVAAARVNTLQAERSRDAYVKGLDGARRRVLAELDLARQRRDAAATGPEGRVESLRWANQALLLEAGLAALGQDAQGGVDRALLPSSYAELQNRLRAAREGLAEAERPADPMTFDPEVLQHASTMGLRYWFARQSLNGVPIGKGFGEGWVEARLKSPSTPPEVLLSLAKLRLDKADRMRRTDVAHARAEADILLSQFETNVRLLRWAEGARGSGDARPLGAGLDGARLELTRRLQGQRAVIAALLRLPEDTTLEALARLVPSDPGGEQSDLSAIAARFVYEARAANMDKLRRTVFEDGLPEALGNEDGLIGQLRADVIAERMSYKGFTPVAAFGYFRGKSAGGVFLEAPDPRAIEQGLTKVLNDSLRKELLSQGRMQELTLKLHLLMTGVQDRAVLLERRHAAVREIESEYRATLARFQQGMAGAGELVAAQEAVAAAWSALMSDAAALKNDFIELVTELEALGYPARDRFAPTPRVRFAPRADRDPSGELVRYASGRMLDAEFAGGLDRVLAGMGPGLDARLRSALAEAGERYRSLSASADSIRVHDLPPAEKLDLLRKADVEGARQRVEALLVEAVLQLGRLDPRSNPGWAAVLNFLAGDLRDQSTVADADLAGNRALLGEMRTAFWHAVPRDAAVEGAFQRLEGLAKAKDDAKQELLADYLGTRLSPTEFVMRDLLLDRYLRAEAAYDAELLKTYESAEVKSDRSLAVSLNAQHPIGAAIERQRDLVRFGRGMAAIDALIMLEQGRLAASRFERAGPADVRAIASALSQLQGIKEQWRSSPEGLGPGGLKPLYAVTEVDADGRRLWTVQGWHTEGEVEGFKAAGRATADKDGRLWLFEAENGRRLELVSGVDVAEARRERDQAAAEDNARSLGVHETLQSDDFALTAFDGRVRRGLSYQELMNAGAKGRVFHFGSEADARTGLRLAKHPLVALLDSPDKTRSVVYVGSRQLSRDQFPSWESLAEHRARLATSADPDDRLEAERFLIVRVGEKGAAELLEHARQDRQRSLRAGWIGIKLGGYGFALDGAGNLTEVYLAKDDFEASRDALTQASETLAKAKAAVGPAEAAVKAAEKEAARLRAIADEEHKVFAVVKREVEAAVQPKKGEEPSVLVAKDGRLRKAQAAYAEKAKAADEAETKAGDARRARDKAIDAISDAETLVTRSRSWRLFAGRDVRLGFDGQQALVSVTAQPMFGSKALVERFGAEDVRVVSGELLAAVLDSDGRALKLYLDRDDVEKAGETWTIQEVNGAQWSSGGRQIDPNFRLSHYVDPETGRPVLVSRRFMIDRLTDAQGRLGRANHWGLLPWQWLDLALEIPRGIIKTPLELLTGRDPSQEHYLGRVNMYKTEGGMTEHHGFARRVLGVLDILDLLPDPVYRAYDPSQFPAVVQLDDPIRPGENIQGKDARATVERNGRAKDMDVHFGRGHLERTVRYEVEDLLNAKSRLFTYFEGGARTSTIETRRGRDGSFETSRVIEGRGRRAIDAALKDPVVAAGQASGQDIEVQGDPGALEVDRVVKRVTVRPGSRQFEATEAALDGYGKVYAAQRDADRQAVGGLRDAAAKSEAALGAALSARRQVEEEAARMWEELHRLAWRIGRQRVIEEEIRRVEGEIAVLREEIRQEKEHIRWLEQQLQHPDPANPGNPTNPTNPPQPTDPGQPGPGTPDPGPGSPDPGPGTPAHSTFWAWVLAGSLLAGLAAAIWYWLRRRREAAALLGRLAPNPLA